VDLRADAGRRRRHRRGAAAERLRQQERAPPRVDYAAARDLGHGLVVAERLFVLTTVGTVAALTKLVAGVFLGRRAATGPRSARGAVGRCAPRSSRSPSAWSCSASVRNWLGAARRIATLAGWGLPSAVADPVVDAPITHGPTSAPRLFALVAGVGLHVGAGRSGLYALHLPAWASLDRAVLAAARASRGAMGASRAVPMRSSTAPCAR
jgi:hypothetical protein